MGNNTETDAIVIKGTDNIDFKCVVYFRPNNDWEGEYGFDWLKTGNSIYGKKEPDYNEIVGYYHPLLGFRNQDFDKLESEYRRKNIVRDKIIPYYVPVISPYRFFVDGNHNGVYSHMVKIKIVIKAFHIAKVTIYKRINQNEKTKIKTITKKDFSQPDITINVENGSPSPFELVAYATHEPNKKSEVKETFAGSAIVAGFQPKVVQICLVDVRLRRTNEEGKPTTISSGFATEIGTEILVEHKLQKYLCQAQIIPDFFTERIDLDIDDSRIADYVDGDTNRGYSLLKYKKDRRKGADSIVTTIERIFKDQTGDVYDYDNVYKIFISDIEGINNVKNKTIGGCSGVPSKSAIVFKHSSDSTLCHELMHSLGFHHSFDNQSEHTYRQGYTDNIMDYPTRDDESVNPLKRYTLWLWQWKQMRDNNKTDGIFTAWEQPSIT